MSIWFRWHEGTCEDGKFRAIAVTVGVTPVTVIGLWAMLLEDASHGTPRGIATRGLTFWHAVLGMDRDICEKIINEMEEHGLVTWTQNGDELLINNWKKRQFESDMTDPTAASRQKNYRDRKRHAEETERYGSVTAELRPENRVQITDTEKEETRARRAWPFAEFWSLFPNKVGKGAAEKAFRKVEKSQSVDFPFLLEALRRYAAKNDDRPWCNPATWLNQSRWTDEPAEAIGGKTGRQSGNSGGSLIEAIDEMRARLAGGQNQDFVQQLPARSVPGAEIIPGPGWDGDGAVRRGGGGARDEPTDWLAAEVQVSAKYRGSG